MLWQLWNGHQQRLCPVWFCWIFHAQFQYSLCECWRLVKRLATHCFARRRRPRPSPTSKCGTRVLSVISVFYSLCNRNLWQYFLNCCLNYLLGFKIFVIQLMVQVLINGWFGLQLHERIHHWHSVVAFVVASVAFDQNMLQYPYLSSWVHPNHTYR